MKRLGISKAGMAFAAVCMVAAVQAAPLATEAFVTNKVAEAVAAIPEPDFSPSNATLVATIQETSPAPDLSGYATTNALASHFPVATEDIADGAVTAAKIADWNVTELKISANSVTTAKIKDGAVTGAKLARDVQTQLNTIVGYIFGDDVRVVITNYDSMTRMPSLSIQQKNTNTLEYATIWDEMTRYDALDAKIATNAAEIAALDANKADRAWGFYDSHTGNYAPEGYTWISSPRIAIAGGLAYQQYVTSEGAVWVLESNGMVAETGGETNGFFRVSDDSGNTVFEIVKGDKRMVGATPGDVVVVNDGAGTMTMTIPYAITNATPPDIYFTTNLTDSTSWAKITSSGNPSVAWSGESGAWVATVIASNLPALFIAAQYEAGGETYIRNAAPVAMQQIVIGGSLYTVSTATIDGKTVLTLEAAQ